MALVARPMAIATSTNVTANRPAVARAGPYSAPYSVASFDAAPVEEPGASTGVFHGDGGLTFRDAERRLRGRHQGLEERPRPVRFNAGPIDAPSTEFAAFFETNQILADGRGRAGLSGEPTSGRAVAEAINRYETNAKVIAGQDNSRGETLNMSL